MKDTLQGQYVGAGRREGKVTEPLGTTLRSKALQSWMPTVWAR